MSAGDEHGTDGYSTGIVQTYSLPLLAAFSSFEPH